MFIPCRQKSGKCSRWSKLPPGFAGLRFRRIVGGWDWARRDWRQSTGRLKGILWGSSMCPFKMDPTMRWKLVGMGRQWLSEPMILFMCILFPSVIGLLVNRVVRSVLLHRCLGNALYAVLFRDVAQLNCAIGRTFVKEMILSAESSVFGFWLYFFYLSQLLSLLFA